MRDKWIAGILSLVFPGVGHFYLGFLGRGLFIIGVLIVDIALITFSSISMGVGFLPHGLYPFVIAFITLLGLLIPVIYFVCLFDALQLAHRREYAVVASVDTRVSRERDIEEELLRTALDDGRKKRRKAMFGSRAIGVVLVIIGTLLLVGLLIPYQLLGRIMEHFQSIFAVFLLISGGWLLWQQLRHRGEDYK